MSRSLIERIEQAPLIHVLCRTEVSGLLGEGALEAVVLRDNMHATTSTPPVGGLFVFIGATPSTEWLDGQLALDEHGFVLTGGAIPVARLESVEQTPLLLETSRPGIFCAGDVRRALPSRVRQATDFASVASALKLASSWRSTVARVRSD